MTLDRRSFLLGSAAAVAGAGLPGTAVGAAPATTTAATDWWKRYPTRSGRPWASGTTYWNADTLASYDRLVALSDGGGGGSKDNGRSSTWEAVAGGPVDTPGTIAPRSQLDWDDDSTNFGAQFNHLPPNQAWLCWVLVTVPEDPAQRGPLTGDHTVWHDVRAGKYDAYYLAMGKRIAANFRRKGISLDRFVGRPNHEMNQSNPYQVFPGTAQVYRQAMDHTIDVIRAGAGYALHMAHAPAVHSTIKPTYLEWCPSRCDVLSISYHPSNKVASHADWKKMIQQGDPDGYPIQEMIDAGADTGRPIAFLEWSPRYEAGKGCPIADQVYTWTHDELFAPNADRLLLDLVHSPHTLDPAGYEDGSPGAAAWKRGVGVFESEWRGIRA